ncbi:MAG: beta-ketoacyl synthase chain length factor [Zoogloeaceae bacterium]|nr:beta-ketoacyl synthase chain length factor [Zoogloeaceae bacterium]
MTQPLSAWIDGVGFLAPGLPDWPSARAVLEGDAAYVAAPSVLPAPTVLPPAERRRASRVIKLTLAVGLEAAAAGGVDPAHLATVFTASGADGHNCHALCEQLAGEDRQISPTRFHNSVHNAPAGYWGIATGSMAPTQVLCAYDGSFGAGLIDALGQVMTDQQTTLLLAYDSEYPAPLFATRPLPDVAGVGLILSPRASERSLARLSVSTCRGKPDEMPDAELESLRRALPALRALPLLRLLAQGRHGAVALEYLAPVHLWAELGPC